MKTAITLTFLFFTYTSSAQIIKSADDLEPAEKYDNIYVKKIDTDS